MRTEIHRGWPHGAAIEYLEAKGYEYRDFDSRHGVYRYRGRAGARATIEPRPPTGKCVLTIREVDAARAVLAAHGDIGAPRDDEP